jgi:hypothetical protein
MDPVTVVGTGGALAALAALNPTARALIDKVSSALGTLYEPSRIKKVAHAEAEADRIRAIGRIEVSEIEQRGLVRMVREQGRIQGNIESITAQAAENLSEDANPQAIEDDWVANFFDRCKTVSDPEMQSLWAKILAGEANQNGAFSKRTVELVSVLDKRDATLFTHLCGFVWIAKADVPLHPLILAIDDPIYKAKGLDFSAFLHLDSLGLTQFNTLAGYNINYPAKSTVVGYRGKPYVISEQSAPSLKLQVGHCRLTRAGAELAKISGSTRVEGIEDYVIKYWSGRGVTTTPLDGVSINDLGELTGAS